MPFDIGSFGQDAATQGVGTILGLALGGINDKRQLKQQKQLNNLAIQANQQMGKFNYEQQLKLWNATNYGPQMEQLKNAGLNPALIYGMGGPGGTTSATPSSGVSSGEAPRGGGEILGMQTQAMQLQLMKAQKEVLETEAEKNRASIPNTNASTENIQADTQNKILQSVIFEYTGKETKDTYERITAPGRAIQAKTYTDEMEARQGVAGTIYELWLEGKLKEKSLNEIEQIALQNTKIATDTNKIKQEIQNLSANFDGSKLDNALKELELKLQQRTGVDRSSPWYIKMLGRFFADIAGPEAKH